MVNTSLSRFRQKQQLVLVDDVKHLDSQVSEEEVLGNLPMEDLVKVIQELPPRYRAVFNLYVIEGYSHTEISREMGISEGASRSDLSRAREILRTKLQQQYGEMRKSRNYSV
jgi:RNA polymerase sigma-70 factor (ECF subfamily)